MYIPKLKEPSKFILKSVLKMMMFLNRFIREILTEEKLKYTVSCCMHKSLTQISRIIMLVLDGDSLSQYTENNKGSIQHYHWETGAQTVKWEH